MRYKVRILSAHPREFLLDGDFQHAEQARPSARQVVGEEIDNNIDTGYKIVPVPEIPHKEVTDEVLTKFLTRYRELNWPDEDAAWRKMEVESGVSSFRAGLDKGYEPDGQRWGLGKTWREAKVRLRIRDDNKGGMWVRFVIHTNCVTLAEAERMGIAGAASYIAESLEGEFPVVVER